MADFTRLHTGDEAVLHELEPFLAAAKQARTKNGVPDKQKYKSVASAAEDVGVAGEYKALNKGLSKLVHPTALSIMLVLDKKRERELKDWAAEIGLNYAAVALATGVEFFRSNGIDVSVVDRATRLT